MDKLFFEMSQKIRVYLATTSETDPYEHTVDITLLNPLPIKAIVTDLIDSKVRWSMPGIVTEKAKALIIQSKHRSLIEKSYRIQIGNDYYEGYKVNGRMQISDQGDYVRVYCYVKKV